MPHMVPTMHKVGVRDVSGRFVDTFDLMLQLPWGALITVVVHHDMTIHQLKSAIEFSVGLPSDLLTLGYKRHASLAENLTLREMKLIPGDRVNVILEYGFEELVSGAVSGNTQLIINDIKRHWNEDDVDRRRMVVMFIAAHRGFHYLIDKMLDDGAHPDSITPAGRTPLHIACAMGNGGCIDTLLQHGANTTLKDANNKTPAQLAFSCGQQEAERRMVLYERARSRQTRRLSKHDDWLLTLPKSSPSPTTASTSSSSSWSRSPRFPVSRLARSVTPTLALQELSLSPAPGPELMVKSLSGAVKTKKALNRFSVRRLTQADLDGMSQSSEGSVDSEPAKEEDLPTFDDQESANDGEENEENVTLDTIPVSSPDDTASTVTLQSPSPRPPAMPPAIRPPHLLPSRTTAWQQETRKVRFNDSTKDAGVIHTERSRARSAPARRSVNMSSVVLGSDTTHQSPDTGPDSPSRVNSSGDNQHLSNLSNGIQCNKPIAPPRNKPRASSARLRSPRYNPRYPDDRYGRDEILDMRKVKDIQASLEVSVGLRETTDQPFLSNGRRKATPEENGEAFVDWLEGKVQGAKDRKLLNNVQKMLDEAFGRADEEIKRQEEKRPKITGQSYEDWKKQKDEEVRNKRKAALEKQRQKEEARRLQASTDAENELLIKAWIARKTDMERKIKLSEVKEKKEKQKRRTEKQIAAESAFTKWRLNKEWEELVRLREGKEFFDPALKATRVSVKRSARKRMQSAGRSNTTNLKYGS
ncbi:synphilin-1-like isoform X1 [Lytechinus pictus]|uniref:synphilin-1-like isoform X1 n=2 Tax=Lytechinus pictus TaxID=7653 RepID=UPI0030B9B2BC